MKISWSAVPIAAVFAMALACNSETRPIVEPPDPPDPLMPGVYRLTGISPTLPVADLEPLRGIVGDARFVALGESTHTSEGYYQAKARVIRFMIEHMGFRVVTFENPWL